MGDGKSNKPTLYYWSKVAAKLHVHVLHNILSSTEFQQRHYAIISINHFAQDVTVYW